MPFSLIMIPLNVIADYQVTPIISITFYMVIIRIGLATRNNRTTSISLVNMSTDDDLSAERRRRMQVLITAMAERKPDEGQRSLMSPVSDKNPPSEIGLDGVGEAV